MKVTLDGINVLVKEDAERFVEECEKNYFCQVKAVSEEIATHNGRTLVMLAGPSGSGKTTTASMLKKDFQKMLYTETNELPREELCNDQGMVG